MHVHVIYTCNIYSTGKFTILKLHLARSARPGLELTTSGTQSPSTIPTIYIEGDIATEYKLSVDFKITLTQTRVFKNKITIL